MTLGNTNPESAASRQVLAFEPARAVRAHKPGCSERGPRNPTRDADPGPKTNAGAGSGGRSGAEFGPGFRLRGRNTPSALEVLAAGRHPQKVNKGASGPHEPSRPSQAGAVLDRRRADIRKDKNPGGPVTGE